MIVLLFASLRYTIFSHAYTLVGLEGSMIVFARLIMGKPVDKNEFKATIIIFSGALIMGLDGKAEKSDSGETNILLGDLLALISGISGVFAILASESITMSFPLPRHSIMACILACTFV